MAGARVALEDVWREYSYVGGKVEAVRGVTFAMEPGEFVALVGPSGSGKSTLLHMIGGLDKPTRGRVLVDDAVVSEMGTLEAAIFRNRTVGFVFQDFYLQQHLTAAENVELPLKIRGTAPKLRRKAAENALSSTGILHRKNHLPRQLSGGERQRVAIARALVTEPRLLLADEPTGNLDSVTGARLMDLLFSLNTERGMTVAVVTHDPEVASRAKRRLYLHDGRLVKDEK